MKTYESKTGYVKNKLYGLVYEAKIMYLGKYDKVENYEDISKEEYENVNGQKVE